MSDVAEKRGAPHLPGDVMGAIRPDPLAHYAKLKSKPFVDMGNDWKEAKRKEKTLSINGVKQSISSVDTATFSAGSYDGGGQAMAMTNKPNVSHIDLSAPGTSFGVWILYCTSMTKCSHFHSNGNLPIKLAKE